MIRFEGVHKWFGNLDVLNNINLQYSILCFAFTELSRWLERWLAWRKSI